MEVNPPNIILHNNVPFQNQLLDVEANYGPLELNLLERVETGLTIRDTDSPDDKSVPRAESVKGKFQTNKEIIFITGWVNIESVYERYLWGFICKILIGISVALSLVYNNQNFLPLVSLFLAINLTHTLKNLFFIFCYRKSAQSFKSIFLFEFQISFGYLTYFLGFFLLYRGEITNRFLPLYSLPNLIIGIFLFLTDARENTFLAQKKFQIFEAFQLLLIALKFSEIGFVNWNYTLLFFMSASIYMTVLGILMSIILSCSLFGFLYRNIEGWKIKSLLWMTWYYISSGMVYIYFIKGLVQLYHEEDFYEATIISDYLSAKSSNYQVLLITSVFLSLFSFASLLMHLIWKKEIKKYLTKIIYKEELRKEVSLRMLTDSFTFKMVRLSTTYFIKPKENEKDQSSVNLNLKKEESELCEFCCVREPDIVLETCGHGGVCQDCLVKYLTINGSKCPWCKCKIGKVYLMNYCTKSSMFYVKGEIDFKI